MMTAKRHGAQTPYVQIEMYGTDHIGCRVRHVPHRIASHHRHRDDARETERDRDA